MGNQKQHQEMSKYQLKKLIKKLEDIRGRNTELVSLYIPAGYDMSKISEFVTSEASEAENIKSKHTRKNVQAALDKIGRKVKEEQQTPENGVAFFAGNVSEREGRPDIQVWEVIPPQPFESRHYRCDKEFVLEPLRQMVVDDKVYGLIVADKNDAAIGFLQGNSVKTVQAMSSNVPGKTKAGGQSAQRFERFRKEMYHTWMNDISDKAKQAFLPKKREDKLLGIIVGGPGFTKDKLIEDNFIHQELQEKIVAKESTDFSGEEGLEELVTKAEDSIEDSQVIKEKNLVQEFFDNLEKENGKSEYGPERVKEALDMGAVETVLISESTELYYAEFKCENDHHEHLFEAEASIPEEKECEECNHGMELVEISDIVDEFGEKAEEMSSDLEIIGNEHEEGRRLENMGGVAAILRYRVR